MATLAPGQEPVQKLADAKDPATSPAARWCDIAMAFALLEGALWSALPTQMVWGFLLLCFIVLRTVRGGRTASWLGLAGPALRHGWWIVPAAAAFAALLLLGARGLGTLHDLRQEHRALFGACMYTVWSVVQEFMAQSFILVRLEELLQRKWAPVIATALIFSVAHIPNVLLILLTLFGGAVFSALFQRYRNLYVLGIAHSILGLSLSISMPDWVLHHMKVGLGYFGS